MARASRYEASKVEVLEAIEAAMLRHSKVPAVRELADNFEVAPATMHSWLSKLAAEELITWDPGRHRSLRLTPQASQQLSSRAGQSA